MTLAKRPDDPIDEAMRKWVDHGWAPAADGMAMITSIMRVQRLFLQRVDGVLRPLGLTFARYEILMLLTFSRAGSLPMKRLGSRLQVHPTSITSAVDRLEAQGFVERRPLPGDRRAVLAWLTDDGRAAAAAATAAINEEVFEQPGLDPQDVRALTQILRRFRSASGDF